MKNTPPPPSRGVILASASPRRERLLRVTGVRFCVRPVGIAEEALPEESPAEMVARLSLAKARAAGTEPGFDIVVGSDTAVTLPGEGGERVLGKPANRAEVAQMMALLGGREHSVYTGIAALDGRTGRGLVGVQRVGVRLRPLAGDELERYVASGIGDDKAGAYAVQDRRFRLVESLQGCASAAMGLPLCLLRRAFVDIGLPVPPLAVVAAGCSAQTGLPCCIDEGGTCPEVELYAETSG